MRYTVIFLFNEDLDKVLLMLKSKGPYPGCLNGVGGKIKDDEFAFEGARRETQEETGVEISPKLLVRCLYPSGCELNVYYAVICEDAPRQMEEEPVMWFGVDDVIKNQNIGIPFAGEGNTQYFVNAAWIALREAGE